MLSDKNFQTRTATCSICGPVKMKVRPNDKVECNTKVLAQHKIYMKKRRYGLTPETWDEMLIAQSGRCAICLAPMRNPQVDHCHESGHVRGMLCVRCNSTLGFVHDDTTLLQGMIEYLS